MQKASKDTNSTPECAALAVRLAALEAKVASIEDRQRILDVYRRYTRGLNRCDVDLLYGVFWPDAQINYGFQSRLRDEWISTWKRERYLKGLSCQAHHITNETIDIDIDVAHVESYLLALWRPPQDDRSALIIGGRYIDRLDRRSGEWRITVREFIPHFRGETNSVFLASYAEAAWPKSVSGFGTGDRTDPCYLRPLNPRTA